MDILSTGKFFSTLVYMQNPKRESLRQTIAWQRSYLDFRWKIADIIVPSRRDGGIIPMFLFFSMQCSPWYAKSDAEPMKVRQMHPGHDLKSKSTSLHQNRQAQSNKYIYIKYIVSLRFFLSFLISLFFVILIFYEFCSTTVYGNDTTITMIISY